MKITFTSLADGTPEEYRYLQEADKDDPALMVEHLLKLFHDTDRDNGYPLTPMRHALQTATRALRDGADDEWVVAALFHDIGDVISPSNHAKVGADLLQPYVSEKVYWVVAHHALFQGYYFWHHLGKDRDAREAHRGSPYFDDCVTFCEKWDQVSFDPDYDTLPLSSFIPAVRRIFSREPFGSWRSQPGKDIQ